ncbi:hypothetical protein S40285_05862 [Stachybotrys chlorohalonatus IBT 40285]|uniref:Signal recognition particle subunit SRP14 n=1 Tax=Stachybotrys chlorohalonatus (strain IBT 40285) TaxID=1283841 RepID=A0A084QBM5_STAC4|nr:hypothetical protein S40285_05862 [Stachybotrys chlorohalonata IBT 40285]
MGAQVLSHDEMEDLLITCHQFFAKLTQLFDHRKGSDHGLIYLSQKRLTYQQDLPSPTAQNAYPDLDPGKPLPLVIHATNGKSKRDRSDKVKLTTVVQPDDLEAFYVRYADVCKLGMTALKPRDRSKKKAKAKKKKTAA